MLDLGLVAQAKKAIASKERHFITPAILLAVVDQESHCANIFVDTKPGGQYALNIQDALVHKVRDRKTGKVLNKIPTGLKESELRSLLTLPEEIDGWKVPKEFAGQKAKWRFEFGWWQHYKTHPSKEEKFYLSSSWGLVQFMGFNIIGNSGKAGDEAVKFIKRFACDVPLQLLYAAGELDRLLIASHGDVFKMYCGYNSGDINSENSAVHLRAKAVAERAIKFQTEIK